MKYSYLRLDYLLVGRTGFSGNMEYFIGFHVSSDIHMISLCMEQLTQLSTSCCRLGSSHTATARATSSRDGR
jgi:hypothetical protein